MIFYVFGVNKKSSLRLKNKYLYQREKGRDLTQSFDKSPYTHEKIKNNVTIQNATKTSITQLLQADLGRSVGVTTATPLVLVNWFTSAQSSH